MNIQIFGTKKCNETRKAERYFKERHVKFQLVNLLEKNLSAGELDSVAKVVGLENLIDTGSKEYQKQQLQYMRFDLREKLLEHPGLLATPIVRNGKEATVGYRPEVWDEWRKQG